jgi:hypothetical protein
LGNLFLELTFQLSFTFNVPHRQRQVNIYLPPLMPDNFLDDVACQFNIEDKGEQYCSPVRIRERTQLESGKGDLGARGNGSREQLQQVWFAKTQSAANNTLADVLLFHVALG